MIDTTNTSLPHLIGLLLAPIFLVSGSASMNWGLQRLQSMLTARIHKLNDERSELQNEAVLTAFNKMRQRQIEIQLQSMMRRARYTRNAIAGFYAACLALLLCSVSIAAAAWLELEATWICTTLFELGILFVVVALVYTLLDVSLSYHAVQADSQAARDSAGMLGADA